VRPTAPSGAVGRHQKPDLPCDKQSIVSKQTTTSRKGHRGVNSLTRPCRGRWRKHRTKYDYDAWDRPTKVTYPDGSYEQITYQNLDPLFSRDRMGRWTVTTYNALQQLTAIQDALGRVTSFERCGCGALESITDPLGRTTTFLRDLQKRVTAKIYPDGTQLKYVYENATSRLKNVTDAKNQTTRYSYYNDNNLKQVVYSNAVVATPGVSFTHDTNYNRVLTMSDGIGVTTYSYYPVAVGQLGAGRLASVTGPLPNATVTYSYDELGRITNRAINGVAQQLTYDALGRVTIITNALGSFTNVYVRNTGLVATNFYPNGQQTVYSYYGTNHDERLQQIQNLTPAGQNLSTFGYAYDTNGQITNWTEQADNDTPTVQVLEYDPVNQLLSSTVHSGTIAGSILKQFIYQYDAAGNRTSEQTQSGAGVPPAISSSSYNNLNQLTSRNGNSGPMRFRGSLKETGMVSVAGSPAAMTAYTNFTGYATVSGGTNTVQVIASDYNGHAQTNNYQVVVTNNGVAETLTYDLNGNLVSAVTPTSTNTYQWDAANRLVSIAGPTNQSLFAYDGLGRRLQTVELQNGVPMSTNFYLWCGMELCGQRDSTGGTVTKQYSNLGERISNSNYYFTKDHLGSIREMTDGSGTIQARYDYDPYGRRTKVSGNMVADFGFAGYYNYSDKLYSTLFRIYDSDLGRWISRDPLGETAGINHYVYVYNNPPNYYDALGLKIGTIPPGMGFDYNDIRRVFERAARCGITYGPDNMPIYQVLQGILSSDKTLNFKELKRTGGSGNNTPYTAGPTETLADTLRPVSPTIYFPKVDPNSKTPDITSVDKGKYYFDAALLHEMIHAYEYMNKKIDTSDVEKTQSDQVTHSIKTEIVASKI
jgi:RHS repeat-associated protein